MSDPSSKAGAVFLQRKDMSNALKWHGGKQYLADWIKSHMPVDFVHYVEPFFGAGAVLFSLPPGRSEVVNDTNHSLMNFWNVLRNETLYADLIRMADLTPISEDVFKQAQILIENPEYITDVTYAWAFFVVARQSRQGLLKDFATLSRRRARRGMNEQASAWLSAVDGLPEVHARLQGVVVLNRPAVEVIKQQDGPDTFFYLDPPYLHESRQSTKDYGKNEMSKADHEALLDVLEGIEGRFALSGYPSDLYSEYTKVNGWNVETKSIDNKASNKSTKDIKTECLWMNY